MFALEMILFHLHKLQGIQGMLFTTINLLKVKEEFTEFYLFILTKFKSVLPF